MLKTILLILVVMGLSSCNSKLLTSSKIQLYYDCVLENTKGSKSSHAQYDAKVTCARKYHQIVPPLESSFITGSAKLAGYSSEPGVIIVDIKNHNEDWIISEAKIKVTIGKDGSNSHIFIRNFVAEATSSPGYPFHLSTGYDLKKRSSEFSWSILRVKGIKIDN